MKKSTLAEATSENPVRYEHCLDVLLDREPFSHDGSIALSLAQKKEFQGLLCATTVTTLYYLCNKALGSKQARDIITELMDHYDIAPVTGAVLHKAVTLTGPDFEDSVLCASAILSGADIICTRDQTGFTNCPIPLCTPAELIALLKPE